MASPTSAEQLPDEVRECFYDLMSGFWRLGREKEGLLRQRRGQRWDHPQGGPGDGTTENQNQDIEERLIIHQDSLRQHLDLVVEKVDQYPILARTIVGRARGFSQPNLVQMMVFCPNAAPHIQALIEKYPRFLTTPGCNNSTLTRWIGKSPNRSTLVPWLVQHHSWAFNDAFDWNSCYSEAVYRYMQGDYAASVIRDLLESSDKLLPHHEIQCNILERMLDKCRQYDESTLQQDVDLLQWTLRKYSSCLGHAYYTTHYLLHEACSKLRFHSDWEVDVCMYMAEQCPELIRTKDGTSCVAKLPAQRLLSTLERSPKARKLFLHLVREYPEVMDVPIRGWIGAPARLPVYQQLRSSVKDEHDFMDEQAWLQLVVHNWKLRLGTDATIAVQEELQLSVVDILEKWVIDRNASLESIRSQQLEIFSKAPSGSFGLAELQKLT